MFEGLLNGFFQKEKNLLRIPEREIEILKFEEDNSVCVFLTEEEFESGCNIACKRCREAYKQGRVDSYVNGREYDAHIQGVLAEIAVAKYFDILDTWKPTINTFRSLPDIEINGKPIEVKSSGNERLIKDTGFTIKQSTLKRDNEDIFIFVYCDIRQVSTEFKCKILGYATAQDVKEEYNKTHWVYPYNKIKNLKDKNVI